MTLVSHTRALCVAAATIGLAACVQAPPPESDEADAMIARLDTDRACFMQREIHGYSEAPRASRGRERILLDTGVDEEFLLETLGPCPELDFTLAVALDQRGAGSVCTGDVENLVVPRRVSGEMGICPVRVLGRLRDD